MPLPDFPSFKLPWQRDEAEVYAVNPESKVRSRRFLIKVFHGFDVPYDEALAIAAAIQSLPELLRQRDEAEAQRDEAVRLLREVMEYEATCFCQVRVSRFLSTIPAPTGATTEGTGA